MLNSRASLRRREIQKLTEELDSIISRKENILEVSLNEKIRKLAELLGESNNLEEINSCSEVIQRLAVIIFEKTKALKNRSGILYIDPFLMKLAILGSDVEKLSKAFIQSWRPVVGRDVINPFLLRESMIYWNSIIKYSFEERETQQLLEATGRIDFLDEREMSEEIERMCNELEKRGGKELYEKLIESEDFSEKLFKAVVASFMITYGYASIIREPLKGKVWVVKKEREKTAESKNPESFIIVVK